MIGPMSMRGGIFLLLAVLAACNSRQAPTTPASAPAPAATSSEVTGIVPKNAIVTLLPASGAPPMPAEPAVLDQLSKQFLPHTLLAHEHTNTDRKDLHQLQLGRHPFDFQR